MKSWGILALKELLGKKGNIQRKYRRKIQSHIRKMRGLWGVRHQLSRVCMEK
jgi:hypothetical protein